MGHVGPWAPAAPRFLVDSNLWIHIVFHDSPSARVEDRLTTSADAGDGASCSASLSSDTTLHTSPDMTLHQEIVGVFLGNVYDMVCEARVNGN